MLRFVEGVDRHPECVDELVNLYTSLADVEVMLTASPSDYVVRHVERM